MAERSAREAQAFQSMVELAYQYLDAANASLVAYRVMYEAWFQHWGNTACGFGGVAGQAITAAPTFVFYDESYELAVVFHAYRFAYVVRRPTQQFFERVAHHNLPGAANVARDPAVLQEMQRE